MMLPPHLRQLAKRTLAKKQEVNLAVFGPGRGSPYFQKRELAVGAIRQEFPKTDIRFYLIDDLLTPVKSYSDYVTRFLPEEIRQIEWADVILFLVTHHRLTAFVEFVLAREVERNTGEPMMAKVAIAVLGDVLDNIPALWAYETRRLLDGNPDRIVTFADTDLNSCRVAKDIGVELFERVVIERWADLNPV